MNLRLIPTRRIVDEDEYGNFVPTDSNQQLISKSSSNDSKGKEDVTDGIEVKSIIDEEPSLEYRDEKDRKWWKFFDEYEYRVNRNTQSKKKWYKWFHEDDTPEERKLILKMDLILTVYSMMAYFVKYLDQANITNAYVGGLKEGIHMQGNDFIDTQIMYILGNVLLQLPLMYVFYAVPLTYVLPPVEIGWSVCTILTSQVKNVPQLKALRFLVGAFEAPFFTGFHVLFQSWYRGSTGELARRAGFYYIGQYLGVLTSGLLSGAIVRGMEGVGGYAAWQWIFIIDGLISIFIAILGFYMIPGTPQDCYSVFLTDNDIRVARSRMKKDQKAFMPRENVVKYFFDKQVWIKIFTSWETYIVALWCAFFWNNGNINSGAYALWLKSLKNDRGEPRFGPGELQDYTALTPALAIVWLILICGFADLFSCRWGAIVIAQVFNMLGNVILAIWHVPEGAKWFAFMLQYFSLSMSSVLYTWQGDIYRKDVRMRQVVLVSMNMFAQSTTAWTSKLVWKTAEGPRFLKGYSFAAVCSFALCVFTLIVLYIYKRQERRDARENGIVLYNSSSDTDGDQKS
ncbi:uncharacterized protein LODBEIA_P30420 [Lodderomyces beijingensis]|uniref:Transporter SEO1 n=1 Tax=Lodderomyces beijingensis TaxID=1775926 RepID=A0ABP0ZKZ5_9ASCO